jgi:hypothetical protein
LLHDTTYADHLELCSAFSRYVQEDGPASSSSAVTSAKSSHRRVAVPPGLVAEAAATPRCLTPTSKEM